LFRTPRPRRSPLKVNEAQHPSWSGTAAGGRAALKARRVLRPDVVISFRAIPESAKVTVTAVGHHEGFSGSLFLVDSRIPDDGRMGQVKRITPEYFFPEVEPGAVHAYGTAWPLDEDSYLCNFHSGLYFLDRFGNRESIFDPGRGPYRVQDSFPVRSRRAPPVLPVLTWQGKRDALPDHRRGGGSPRPTLAVVDLHFFQDT
jgi:hypothetical protein